MLFPEGGGYEPYSYNHGSANSAESFFSSFDTYVSAHTQQSHAYGAQLKPGERFNSKIPPSYGGGSFFAYMEDVKDWQTLTDVDIKKQGPMLKNALGPLCGTVKTRLLREELVKDTGVTYLLDMLRKHFIKGKTSVFFWRMKIYLSARRGRLDFMDWIIRWTNNLEKVKDAWMDLVDKVANSRDRRYAGLLTEVEEDTTESLFRAMDDAERLRKVN